MHEPSTALADRGRAGRGRLGYALGRRAELVRPAPVRRSRARPRRAPLRRPAHLRHAPDARTAPADVVDQVAGRAGARPGGEHGRLDRAPARPSSRSWTRSGRCSTGPGVFVYGSNDLYSPIPKNPLRYLWRTAAARAARHMPDLPWAELGAGMDGGRVAGREQPARPDQGRGPGHRGWRACTTRTSAGTGTTRSPGPPTPPPTCGSACMHSPEPGCMDRFAADGYDLLLAGHTHGGQVCAAVATGPWSPTAASTASGSAGCTGTRRLAGPGRARTGRGCTSPPGSAPHRGPRSGSPAGRRQRCSRWCRGSARLPGFPGNAAREIPPSAGGGVWRSLAARFVRDEEAAGSNPATPTR